MLTAAVLTISDKGSRGERIDESGPALIELLRSYNVEVVKYHMVPDEIEEISKFLIHLCDELCCNLVLTTGGTGFSKRDVTPEATAQIIERQAPGIAEAMRFESFKLTSRAILSRGVSGIRKESIIVNLPGSPKAAVENLQFVLPALLHGIAILKGTEKECGNLK